ncbi:MAG: hypothetical protein HQK62_00510 [Desulfamplus sp.]|nr:hypothetical protein [Desulfamplus sp.]
MEGDTLSNLRLSGYGTISYTLDDHDDIAPMRDIRQMPQNPFKTNSTWRLDSRLAIQADYRFSPEVEFVIQGALRDRYKPSTKDLLESCYLGLSPAPTIDVRVGRIGYDAFLMSDIRNAGYTYLWVRPPIEFYGWIPIFHINGIDAAYNFYQEDAQWRIKVQRGESGFPIQMGTDTYDFNGEDLWSVTLLRQDGPFRLKAGYSQFTSKNEVRLFKSLHQGLEAVAEATSQAFPDISAEALSLRNDIYFGGNKVTYMTVGAAYDDGTWIAQSEIGRSTATGDVLPNGDMAYFSMGYRIQDFTPYFTFSTIEPGSDLHKPASDWNAIGQGPFQSQAIRLINSTRMKQYTNTIGVRWDFSNQLAVKVQLDNTHIYPFGYGLWIRREGESPVSPSDIRLLSFSLDFVF